MSPTTQSTASERDVPSICRRVFNDTSDDVLATGLSSDVISGLLTVLTEREDLPFIRILATESAFKEAVSDFTDASTIADFVAQGVFSLRATDVWLDGQLLLTNDTMISIISTGTQTAGLTTTDDKLVENVWSQYEDLWDDAESFTLRTPPLSRIRETLNEEFGSELLTDFDRMRTALDTGRGGSELNEVDICLLAAAKSEILLYDISTWGENVDVASRATFSRKKARLEEMDLIDTEKVPIDVGRPRQRLVLDGDRLCGIEADELVSVAGSVLSATGS